MKKKLEDTGKWQDCEVCGIYKFDIELYEMCYRCSSVERAMVREQEKIARDQRWEEQKEIIRNKLAANVAQTSAAR